MAGRTPDRARGLAEGAAQRVAAGQGVRHGERDRRHAGFDGPAEAFPAGAQQARHEPGAAGPDRQAAERPERGPAGSERERGACEQQPSPLCHTRIATLATNGHHGIHEARDAPREARAPGDQLPGEQVARGKSGAEARQSG